MKLTIRKKALILLGAAIFIGAAFWFFYHSPLRSELEDLKNQHTRLRSQKVEVNKSRATYEKDRAKRDELKKNYGQQLRALPTEAEISSFLNKLNTQADLLGLEIASVQPKKEEISQYYAKIPVKLELAGTYHQLAKFFYLVGNLDRIINIENITLRVKKIEESNAILNASVLATTFRSIQPEPGSKEKKDAKNKKGAKKR